MSAPFDSAWRIGLYEIKKDEKPRETPPLDSRDVHSLADIFSFLEPLKFEQLHFFIEVRLDRIIALPDGDFPRPHAGDPPDGTRLCLVNFPVTSCTQLFIDLLQSYFQGGLTFPREPRTFGLFRRQQNYSIEILFSGYELALAGALAAALVQFCRGFQERRLGAVDEELFSVEISPAARRCPARSGAKKISAKNTADSVASFLRKRPPLSVL
jgi:hypothetical protein